MSEGEPSGVSQTYEPKGCLTALLQLFGITLREPTSDYPEPATAFELPYRLRDDFLSPAELSFYRVLQLAVNDQAVILAKVNLSDLFFVVRPNENQAYRNKIDRKHVDFVLAHPATMKPLVAVELDDSSHQRPDRAERDQFVDQVFETAGMALIRVPARSSYDPNTLAAALRPHLIEQSSATANQTRMIASSSQPTCPKCGVPMVQRVASKGNNKGKEFWGCPNFPRCRQIA